MKKAEYIQIRVEKEDKEEIRAAAKLSEESISSYGRKAIHARMRDQK